MRRTIALVVAAAMAGACTGDAPPDVAFEGPSEIPASAPVPDDDVAWRRLATAEGVLEGSAAAEAVQSQPELHAAWQAYGFAGHAPAIDFERSFVLLLGQPDDDCVDDLIGLDVVAGDLRAEWLPPPGGCNEPLVLRIHAVEIDRRHVPARFDVAFPQPYSSEAEPVTIHVATVGGEAPAAPQPPPAMSDAELDAVFADHPVRRCTPADARLGDGAVDGRLSDDPRVAEAQRRRADFGVPSDEQTTREVMSSPDRSDELDFPVLDSELEQDHRTSRLLERVRTWLERRGYRQDVDYVPFVSRTDGIRPGVWIDGGAAALVRTELEARFGRGTVAVEDNPYDFEAVNATQRDLGALIPGEGDGPGRIAWLTGIPGPVEIGMIDPTREALDRIAATVSDPALVCVEPSLSGVTAEVGRR